MELPPGNLADSIERFLVELEVDVDPSPSLVQLSEATRDSHQPFPPMALNHSTSSAVAIFTCDACTSLGRREAPDASARAEARADRWLSASITAIQPNTLATYV